MLRRSDRVIEIHFSIILLRQITVNPFKIIGLRLRIARVQLPKVIAITDGTPSSDQLKDWFSNINGANNITYKMELARLANRIVVMESGRIVEEGTHDELMQRKNLYFKLCTSNI